MDQFNPAIVHVDFELAVMNILKEIFSNVSIKCCRFHLAQILWRKIQKVGLSQEYKSSESEIGMWLKSIFVITFLGPEEVEDAFVEDFISIAPNDKRFAPSLQII